MKRLLILAPALLLAFPAVAQDAPVAGYQNLWCQSAFTLTSASIPALPEAEVAAAIAAGDAATPEQKELLEVKGQIDTVLSGIPVLLAAANASYTEAGFTAEQFEAAKTEADAKVTAQIGGTDGGATAEFTFEQCLALLPAAEAPAP
jgi:hypothetical protein